MSELTGKENTKQMQRRKRLSVCLVVFVILLFSAIGWFVGRPLVQAFTEHPENFRAYVQSHGVVGPFIMIGIIMLQIVIALIPGEPFELAAGFVFGWLEGSVLCLLGSALASMLVYGAVHKWGVSFVELFFPREKIMRFSFMRNEKKLDLLVFLMFLIPGTPKDLLTYVIGLTPMKVHTFVLISSLARIPSVISSAVTGSFAQSGQWVAAIITYGITGIITLVCVLWYRRISREEKARQEDSAIEE